VKQVLEADPSAAQEPFWEHDCEPPLCYAARLGCSLPIFALILDHGADVGAVDRRGRTPLAILSTEPCVVDALPDMFMLGACTLNPINAVQIARRQNTLDVTKLLMEAGADIEHVDLSNSRPMDHALRAHNQPLLQILASATLQNGAGLRSPGAAPPSRLLAPGMFLTNLVQ